MTAKAGSETESTADLAKLKVDDFLPLVGTDFGMTVAAAAEAKAGLGVIPLRLVKAESNGVQRHASSGPGDKVRAGGGFSLEFITPEQRGLPQGIYRIEHPKLGKMDIFLVPSGPARDGFGYHTSFA